MTVIDAEISFSRTGSWNEDDARMIRFDSLHIRYGGVVSAIDEKKQYTFNGEKVDISPGGTLQGRHLLLQVNTSLTIAETGSLSVDYGGFDVFTPGMALLKWKNCVLFKNSSIRGLRLDYFHSLQSTIIETYRI